MRIPYFPPMTDAEAQERLDRLCGQWQADQTIDLVDLASAEELPLEHEAIPA